MGDDQADKIPLNRVSFWVQIHNLPSGVRTSKIVHDIGAYISVLSWKWIATGNYLRVRVNIDSRTPLKRRMRIKKPTSE